VIGLYYVHLGQGPFSYRKYILDLRLDLPDVVIRRGGNKELHNALVQASMGLIARSCEPLGKWGTRLAARLFLRGVVTGRTRKIADNGVRYMYTVGVGEGYVRAGMWGEHEFLTLGEQIDARVDVRAYISSRSKPMYQLAIRNGWAHDGEEEF
jgi:hypothetical protein